MSGNNGNHSYNFPPLLDQIEHCLGQSLLIFMLADLRILSATGRIGTKYETLSVDSDCAGRTSASEIAGVPGDAKKKSVDGQQQEEVQETAAHEKTKEGISPAHIMTVLFIEIINECEGYRDRKRKKHPQSYRNFLLTDEPVTFLSDDHRQRNMLFRKAEGDMHSMVRWYTRMLAQDLNREIPKFKRPGPKEKVAKLKSDLKNYVNQWQMQTQSSSVTPPSSPAGDTSTAANNSIIENNEVVGEEGTMEHSDDSDGSISSASRSFRRSDWIMKTERKAEMEAMGDFERVEFAIREMASSAPTSNIIRQSLEKSASKHTGEELKTEASFYEKSELRDLMVEAVESRDFVRLDFVKDFFQEGSLSRIMAQSTAKLVWLHDWYPQKECTYGISIDVESKKVLLVFRGAITNQDWSYSFNNHRKKAPNPIRENYDKKIKHIRVHEGFHRYLFRKRKDTGTTKYDEIANKIHEYGARDIGEDYRVEVTGHSLGGALATLFSFYASTEERFTKNTPVQAIAFGCPLVCGYELAHAFRHQERTDKLRCCRVHNAKDGIPHLPPTLFQWSRYGARFYHVGLEVRLPLVRKGAFRWCRQPGARINYVPEEGFWAAYFRQAREHYLLNIAYRPWKIRYTHTLVEHQLRLLVVNEENTPLIKETLEDVYEHFRKAKKFV